MKMRFGWTTAVVAAGLAAVCLMGGGGLSVASEAPAHAFVGVEKCKLCHNTPAKGAQYNQGAKSKHSKAWATLATEEAKKVGAAKGIADPQNAPECLRCHVTGYGSPAEKLTLKYKKEDGVGCESCHGPGADYWKMEVMKDLKKSLAAGLTIPDAKTCVRCHNPENPTHKGFDFATYHPKIAHPMPKKTGGS